MRPIDFPDGVDLARDRTALLDDARREPVFAAATLFDEPGDAEKPVQPDPVRLDPIRLDPGRSAFDPTPPPPPRRSIRGPIGSLTLHLLPLLMLITWPRTPIDMPAPIPVQLVIEQPPPPPPPPPPPKAEPKPPARPPQGRFASDDFAEAEGPKSEKGSGDASPTAGEPHAPAAEPLAVETPTPKPAEPAEPQKEEAPPAPAKTAEAEAPMPAPATLADRPQETATPQAAETEAPETPPPKPVPPKPLPKPPKKQAMIRTPPGDLWPLPLHPDGARRTAARIGPNATQDEYCAYALHLTLRHMDLLPLSFVGSRRGTTVLSIRVLENGTITNVRVTRSSGYSDIDDRIRQMVFAVGRFPPLPQWVTGRSVDFTFQLHFPHPLER